MHRLARLVRQRPAALVARHVRPLSRLRPFSTTPETPESLYAQYLEAAKAASQEPASFEQFQEQFKDVLEDSPISIEPQQGEFERIEGLLGPASDPFFDKYEDIVEAFREMDENDPDFEDKIEDMAREVEMEMEDSTLDPVFTQRLHALEAENMSEREVARRVAQLVLSLESEGKQNDRRLVEMVEDRIATYNGPLSRLNAGVEWYLKNPEAIAREDAAASESEVSATSVQEKNLYYYQDTPYDELVQHLRKRDVVYAIQKRFHPMDRLELLKKLETLVAPMFNENMDTLNAIAEIFNKYEDAELSYHTQPRLARVRRLEVFMRLAPKPDDVTPEVQAAKQAQIDSIIAEKEAEEDRLEAERLANQQPWPNLMTRDPLLDSREEIEFPPEKGQPFHNRVVIRNHNSIFREALRADGISTKDITYTKTEDIQEKNDGHAARELDSTPKIDGRKLVSIAILSMTATQQTGKGRIQRVANWQIMGNGDGLVGMGMGKHEKGDRAVLRSEIDALRSVDHVERFEGRTIWTEVRTKLGATQVILRPRPVGFGLRCNPNIHRLCTAAGIRDISAKVWGSRNKLPVLKATLRLLQAGNAPHGMGNGLGGPGPRMHKGTGLRNKTQIERERGRRMVDLRV
ncbi:37S ribosomal protein [Mycena kentingensis (nom. inval.)]|nr:37S ribosomal protein [Mycena kentingensis (nom. inval.)]